MKAFIVILCVFFSLSFYITSAADQKAVQEKTNTIVPTPAHLDSVTFAFENAKADKFNVVLQVMGKYPINTKLGTERFQKLVDVLREEGVKVGFTANPQKNTLLLLMKFSIPKGKKMKTSEVIFVLDHCSVRPADVCEAISLDRIDQSILDVNLPFCILGMFIPFPEGKTMIFTPTYASVNSNPDSGVNLGTAIKKDNLWEGEMIIPVIITE